MASDAAEVVRQTCSAHVAECTACEWRGNNRASRPCTKCQGTVELRPCRQPPTPGSTVCHWHGGRAPQVERAGRRRLVAAEAAKTLGDIDVEPIGDPLLELADVAAESRALQKHLGALVVERQGRDDPDSVLWLEAYGVAMDRAARLLEACGRLGLEQRRVQVEEWQSFLCVGAMRKAMEELGLDDQVGRGLWDAFAIYVKELEDQYDPRASKALPRP